MEIAETVRQLLEVSEVSDPVKEFKALGARCDAILDAVRKASNPNEYRRLERRWNLVEVAGMVGRHPNRVADAIAALENEGAWPEWTEARSARYRYELRHIQALQRHYGTMPMRDRDTDEPMTLAVAAFKGGVGKTATALQLAEYLAIRGYQVLLVDMDSQASATSAFGYIPDLDIDPETTILPYLDGAQRSIRYAIRKTHFEGLDLVPGCLRLFDAEWGMAFLAGSDKRRVEEVMGLVRDGILTVKDDYDVVIIDSPPSLGMISSNIMRAADALIVPTPPRTYDLSSMRQFMTLCEEVTPHVRKGAGYLFVKVLPTKMNRRIDEQNLLDLMHAELSGSNRFPKSAVIMESADIGNAAQMYKTVLEVRRPPRKTLQMVEHACACIELEIVKRWPSRAMQQRAQVLATKIAESLIGEQSGEGNETVGGEGV